MALSLEQFVRQLAQCGLISADRIADCQNDFPPDQPPDAEQFAKTLVKQGKLTAYQASMVWQGKTKGLVFGEYVVLDKLGQGGMGVVFKARHKRMDRLVAVKMIRQAAIKSPDAVQRFHREVQAAARLNHANIVTAHDAGGHEGMHYLVMQYVEGKDLGRLLAEHGPLPVTQTIQCMLQAARGLEYAHQQGIVHRDIKPGNLLVDRSETVKILDMGSARMVSSAGQRDAQTDEPLTDTAQVFGTFDYMAPEQAEGSHGADLRADIYSLGCTLYRLLTGKPPYSGDTAIQILLAHREAPIPSLRATRADVSPQLDAIFQKMVAKRAKDRYQSMGEVMAALAGYLAAGEQLTEAADEGLKEAGSISSWLERLPGAASPKTSAPAAVAEETWLHHAEHETRPQAHGPATVHGRTKTKHYLRVVGLSAAATVLLLLILSLTFAPAGRRPAPDQPATSDTSRASEKPRQFAAQPQPTAPAWEAAWEQADTKAKGLVAEQRFGEAIEEYKALPSQSEEEALRGRVDEAVARLEVLATQAYAAAETRARQLLADRRYAEAGSALQPVVERYGIAQHTDAAKKVLAEIKAAEPPFVPPPASKPAPSPEELAVEKELERRRQLEARYAEATKSVEALAASWDFRSAAAELNKIRFEEAELTARLAQRRGELKRMHDLEQKLITAINQANPPLKKTALASKASAAT